MLLNPAQYMTKNMEDKKPIEVRREIYESLRENGINVEPDRETKKVLETEEVEKALKEAIIKKSRQNKRY
jgi:hypothetical protein